MHVQVQDITLQDLTLNLSTKFVRRIFKVKLSIALKYLPGHERLEVSITLNISLT